MRYRSTILIAILTVSLSSPTYTNGQTRPEPKVAIKAVGQKAAFLNGPPDLAVSLSSSQEVVFGSTPTDISQLARLSISISNQWSLTKSAPLVLTGSDVQNVHLRVELPQGTLFQVGNIGVDSGFACNTANNNVVCTGGKIAAGRRAYIYVDVDVRPPSGRDFSTRAHHVVVCRIAGKSAIHSDISNLKERPLGQFNSQVHVLNVRTGQHERRALRQ